MTVRPAVKTLLAVTLSLVLLPGAAAAAPDPALPAGPAPEVVHQVGSTVRGPGVDTVTLPAKVRGARVLGQRHGAWIVWVDGSEPEVFVVKGASVRRIWHHTYDESATDYTLVDGADRVVEWNYGRGGESFGTVFDLRGRELGTRFFPSGSALLAADRHGVLVGARRQTLRWVPGRKPVPAGPAAYFADPDHDLLMVPVGDGAVGPTTFAAPGTPAWSAEFVPVVVSPDGAWVAGVTYRRRSRLVVLRLSDGAPAPVPARLVDQGATIPGGPYVQLAWEPDGDLLFVEGGPRGRSITRCTLAGACQRTTKPVKGQVVGFPDDVATNAS